MAITMPASTGLFLGLNEIKHLAVSTKKLLGIFKAVILIKMF